jgi:LPXTG-site transpeptidase (sortase) family protein
LKVVFNKDVNHDTHAGDQWTTSALDPVNYMLVSSGSNNVFDTRTCKAGLKPDDTLVAINSVSYNSSTFTATLSVNGGRALPSGSYMLFVCGTTSITDLDGLTLNYGRSDTNLEFQIAAAIPGTGFTPGQVTILPTQNVSNPRLGDLWLEIPRIDVQIPIVGVPQSTDGTWDVSWLGQDAGWLNGSAYPTWAGNSVLAGHVWNADNTPGPFRYIDILQYGDQVIVHGGEAQDVYEVRSVQQVSPGNTAAMLEHEALPWITLVTCSDYNESSNSYQYRVLVRAVLVEVK